MSQEQEDQVVGRIVREKKDAEQKLARLAAEASRIGEVLVDLGTQLVRYPATIQFEGVATNVEYLRRDGSIFKTNEIDGARIAALTNEIRSATAKLEELEKQAGRLGV